MKSLIRPSTPADGPAIVAVIRDAGLRPADPSVAPRLMHWQYWTPRADWPEPRSYVLARGSDIVAHAGIVPGICAWDGHRLKTYHVIDWAARRGAIGAGSMLMKYVAGLADMLIGIGGSSDTLAMLPTLGFKPYGRATRFVRTLHPLRRLVHSSTPAWQRLPRFARSMLWTLTATPRHGNELRARRLTPDAVGALVLPKPRPQLAVFERSAAQITHLLACPVVSTAVCEVSKEDRACGYFVLAFAPRQARLIDCWIDSDDPADWRGLIQCAVREAATHPDAAELATHASDPSLCQYLADSGFRSRMPLDINLRSASGLLPPPGMLRVQMVENDAAYFHTGGNEFWW